MPKPKLADFKKLLNELTHEELKAEMMRLFQKLDQVQALYAQELLSPEDRRKILEDYKQKIYKEFWTSSGKPKKVKNSKLRSIIAAFEKVSVSQSELVELILYRVEECLNQANALEYNYDANFNSAIIAFEKALKIIKNEQLESYFEAECRSIAMYRNDYVTYEVCRVLQALLVQYFGI